MNMSLYWALLTTSKEAAARLGQRSFFCFVPHLVHFTSAELSLSDSTFARDKHDIPLGSARPQ